MNPVEWVRDKIAGSENRSYDSRHLDLLYDSALYQPLVAGSLEVAGGYLGRCLAATSISGRGAGLVTPQLMNQIGRAMLIQGEFVAVLTEPLSQVFDYEVENGYLVYTNEANERRATREYIRIRYSVGSDGRGIGPLGSASAMAAVIKNIERVAAQEMSGYVASFMSLPSVKAGQTDQIKDDLKKARGRTVFGEAIVSKPHNAQGATVRHEYAQSKVQPRLHETTVRLYEIVCAEVLRACGIPPILLSDKIQPGREAIRLYLLFCVSGLVAIISSEFAQLRTASYPNGAAIEYQSEAAYALRSILIGQGYGCFDRFRFYRKRSARLSGDYLNAESNRRQ